VSITLPSITVHLKLGIVRARIEVLHASVPAQIKIVTPTAASTYLAYTTTKDSLHQQQTPQTFYHRRFLQADPVEIHVLPAFLPRPVDFFSSITPMQPLLPACSVAVANWRSALAYAATKSQHVPAIQTPAPIGALSHAETAAFAAIIAASIPDVTLDSVFYVPDTSVQPIAAFYFAIVSSKSCVAVVCPLCFFPFPLAQFAAHINVSQQHIAANAVPVDPTKLLLRRPSEMTPCGRKMWSCEFDDFLIHPQLRACLEYFPMYADIQHAVAKNLPPPTYFGDFIGSRFTVIALTHEDNPVMYCVWCRTCISHLDNEALALHFNLPLESIPHINALPKIVFNDTYTTFTKDTSGATLTNPGRQHLIPRLLLPQHQI
jgi:hypothetical protein